MRDKKEYNQYLWTSEQPRVYETSPSAISGIPMSEEDAVMSLKAENLQQSLQQNPIFKSAKQWVAQQEQREKDIAASKKWLELHPEDNNDDPYTIFERGKHQAIVEGKDPSYYEKMINDGKQFTKGALGVLSLPYLGAATAGAYGYGASLGARGLFAAQGIHGLTNENGVRKTANLIKSGDYGRAALSGAGDALNAAMILPGAKLLGNAAKYGLKATYVADRLANNVRNVTLPYNIYGNDSRRPLSQFIDVNRNGDSNSYWLKTNKYDKHTGKPLDIRNLDGAKFGDGGYGNDGGKVDGIFMSYGEPWQEFAVTSRDAWYKFPNRSSTRSATNWKGDKMDYSIKDAYDAELAYRKVGDFMESIPENTDPYEMGKMRLFEKSKYPILKKVPQAGDRYFANQTVIPKHELTYSSFLKQPFWKYTEDPISGQVQQELFMQWPKNNTQGKTYLGLLERPSKLSEAERLGIPKGDRGNLSQEQLDALEDLRYLMDTEKVPNPKIKEFITTGVPYDETLGFRIKTPEGYFRYKPVGNRTQFSYEADNFPTDWGEANMKMYSNAREGKIILTSPYADMFSPRNPIPEGVDPTKYSKTIPKNVMRAFWKNLDENIPKGTYVSGDQGSSPLGQHLYEIWKNRNTIVPSQLDNSGNIILKRRGSSLNDFFNTLYNGTKWNARKDGLSTDSYMAILKQGNRPGHKLRFSRDGFTNFNNQGVENKYIYDLHQRMLNGEIPQQDFVNKFNDWVKPYNGMPAKIIDGEVVIPHPFILYKQGGIVKRVESGKSGIHIKPENRGKFTALKKRTGKSSTWYKEHGTPAQKKMAVFALNARKWKHK